MAVDDQSRKGLLASEERDLFDGRDSVDSDSDIDINKYPEVSYPASRTFERPRTPLYKRPCVRLTFGLVASFLLFFIGAGLIGHKVHKEDKSSFYGQSPPWYPTPKGGSVSQWAESYRKASEMVSRMTLPEKVNITTGTGWQMGLAVGNSAPALNVGFPGLCLQDGPLGIRLADNITAFPAGVTVGATFSRELMYRRGNAHGTEAREKGCNILLGPSVGPLGRMPAGGRNWEGFGSDPYLQGVAAGETVRGIQDAKVMATIKHYIANEQEHFRQPSGWGTPESISSNIDDRTLHEIYAWPFGDAVKAGVASLMCSYNQVNNSYACENSKLLNGILKDELGFQGFVMSDWLAQRSGVASALAGLDMTMPGDGLIWADGDSLWGPHLTKAVLNGTVPVERLNDMATRIVAAWYQLGQDDETVFDRKGPNFSSWTNDEMGLIYNGSPSPQEKVKVNHFVNVQSDHAIVARQVAIEGTVLLKNDGVLPLTRDGEIGLEKKTKSEGKLRIGIYGEDAGPGKGPNYCKDRGCNQGTLGSGWGSGAVEFPYLVAPVKALREGFNKEKTEITEYLKNDVTKGHKEILDKQDVCIVFANSDAGEGFLTWDGLEGDRNDLSLQKGGDKLVEEVATHCGGGGGSTIVVIHSVGPVVVDKWIDISGVKAVLAANLPGQESGNAIASLIFGDENPSGKLPYTIGKSLKDYGPGGQIMYHPNATVPQQNFDEGAAIDYRHFDRYGIEPRYEFGFGLSYTSFEYGGINVKQHRAKSALPAKRPAPGATPPEYDNKIPPVEEALFPSEIRKFEKFIYPYINSADDIKSEPYPYPEGYDVEQPLSGAGGGEGGNPDLWEIYVTVSVDVKNVGSVGGKVVPQLYLSYPVDPGSTLAWPVRVLRGFEKVHLDVGESKKVEFPLTRRDLSYWDVERQNWVLVEVGEYRFAVGESSRDVRVTATW
uniref:beta-glucosidase n=1 Tax=Bionectria ochroleuca TaxID=29856 RepID=A0A8H7TTV9_BIOOC